MTPQERARFGARVRQARKEADRTQVEVAKAAGIAPNTLSAIEAGKPAWDANLRAAAAALNLELDHLTFPPDVEAVRDMVGEWLVRIPVEHRSVARRRLTAFITSGQSSRA